VVDLSRIEELRRRIHKDPASIAFAQLAEEYRRAGRFAEAIDTCRTGLAYHPGYLSAHVTLGRALVETGDLDGAAEALARVHAAAPDNLAAIKGLADIHHRRGERQQALALYGRALALAPQDPELEHLVGAVTAEVPDQVPAAAPSPEPEPAAEGPQPAVEPEPAVEAAPAREPEPAREPAELVAFPSLEAAPLGTPEQIATLERWLDAILADRDSRR
jgi:tetratricopeptide (TPR) repeat protein